MLTCDTLEIPLSNKTGGKCLTNRPVPAANWRPLDLGLLHEDMIIYELGGWRRGLGNKVS